MSAQKIVAPEITAPVVETPPYLREPLRAQQRVWEIASTLKTGDRVVLSLDGTESWAARSGQELVVGAVRSYEGMRFAMLKWRGKRIGELTVLARAGAMVRSTNGQGAAFVKNLEKLP